ncbi:MAG: SHOCT-like domain-containing protein [Acutalibacter sp.]
MSEEKRRILDMVEQGTITQEDAARLLEALGENEPAPEPPQESQPPQDGTWEAEHQGDEDCQGPNQRVEIHLEGEGAKPIYQEITAALDEAAPVFENLGKIVEDAVTSATQAVDAAWPQVKEAVSSATDKAKGPPNPPHRPPGRACWWGRGPRQSCPHAPPPGGERLSGPRWRTRHPAAGGVGQRPGGNPPLGGRHHPGGGVCRPPLEGQRAHGAPGKRRQAAYPLEP